MEVDVSWVKIGQEFLAPALAMAALVPEHAALAQSTGCPYPKVATSRPVRRIPDKLAALVAAVAVSEVAFDMDTGTDILVAAVGLVRANQHCRGPAGHQPQARNTVVGVVRWEIVPERVVVE